MESDIETLKKVCSDLQNAGDETCKDIGSMLKSVLLVLFFSVLTIISAASVIFGLVFWFLIPNWRAFRHYAFLNMLLANTGFIVGVFVESKQEVLTHLVYYIFMVFTHWLIVISGMFYFDFAKVFMKFEEIEHVYLISTVFGWLAPGLWITIGHFTRIEYVSYVCIALVFINVLMYVRVLYALFCNSKGQFKSSGRGFKFTVTTLAFICTGIIMYIPIMIKIYKISNLSPKEMMIFCLCYFFTVMAINIFFLMLKVHRTRWAEYQSREGTNDLA